MYQEYYMLYIYIYIYMYLQASSRNEVAGGVTLHAELAILECHIQGLEDCLKTMLELVRRSRPTDCSSNEPAQ